MVLAILTLVGGAVLSVFLAYVVDVYLKRRQAGKQSSGYRSLDLSGTWRAAWQSTVNGDEVINYEDVLIKQQRNVLFMNNVARSLQNPDGGFLWQGQVTIWDNQHMLGYYTAREPTWSGDGQPPQAALFLKALWTITLLPYNPIRKILSL